MKFLLYTIRLPATLLHPNSIRLPPQSALSSPSTLVSILIISSTSKRMPYVGQLHWKILLQEKGTLTVATTRGEKGKRGRLHRRGPKSIVGSFAGKVVGCYGSSTSFELI
ncbi:hypothetical protein L484_023025 [Morus notabilis]|uniref:Uncharacterized protein n=1 Tax=Morus notabilis TaxID=981085 RepID=W9RTA7_9ROSA|nr:hypothetical protein L484_023025 [Morus notabilis]